MFGSDYDVVYCTVMLPLEDYYGGFIVKPGLGALAKPAGRVPGKFQCLLSRVRSGWKRFCLPSQNPARSQRYDAVYFAGDRPGFAMEPRSARVERQPVKQGPGFRAETLEPGQEACLVEDLGKQGKRCRRGIAAGRGKSVLLCAARVRGAVAAEEKARRARGGLEQCQPVGFVLQHGLAEISRVELVA